MVPFSRIVHVHLSGPISVSRKLFFIIISKLFFKKVIIHLHAFGENSNLDANYNKLYKLTFNLSNLIIVLSNSWKDSLISDFDLDPNQVEVLYNPCPLVARDKSIEKDNIILYAGTLNKRKNYSALINAFAKIADKNPNWKIVFAGNGEIKSAKKIAKSKNIENQVEFLGWISGEKKHEIFSKSKIFCLPSYAEGFPMAVLDAWSYGIPVITTPVGGILDVAVHEKNVMLFNPDDIDELAKNIYKVIEDQTLRERLSEKSLDFSKNKFNLNEISRSLNILYENVLRS